MATSRRLAHAGAALLLCAAVLAVSACSWSKSQTGGSPTTGQSQTPSGASDASASVSASGSAASIATGQPAGGASGTGAHKKLSSSDAKAIDAELAAIQKELDNMKLPSDSDFGGIESGLK